jgi:hypothetical protein
VEKEDKHLGVFSIFSFTAHRYNYKDDALSSSGQDTNSLKWKSPFQSKSLESKYIARAMKENHRLNSYSLTSLQDG